MRLRAASPNSALLLRGEAGPLPQGLRHRTPARHRRLCLNRGGGGGFIGHENHESAQEFVPPRFAGLAFARNACAICRRTPRRIERARSASSTRVAWPHARLTRANGLSLAFSAAPPRPARALLLLGGGVQPRSSPSMSTNKPPVMRTLDGGALVSLPPIRGHS